MFGMFRKKSSAIWPISVNNEITSMWHNPDRLVARQSWKELGMDLQKTPKPYPFTGSKVVIGDLGNDWKNFPYNNHNILAQVFVERFNDGDCVKHAILKIPEDSDSESLKLVSEISLAIESDQPAFVFMTSSESGTYWNLLWPQDWKKSIENVFKKWGYIGKPLWHSPMYVVTKDYTAEGMPELSKLDSESQFGILNPGDFETKLHEKGYSSWRKILVQNLKLMVLAELFLNKMSGRNLFLLDTSKRIPDAIVKVIGRQFFMIVFALIKHRFKKCSQCGFYIYQMGPEKDAKVGQDEFNAVMGCVDVSRQFGIADVWPMTMGSYFSSIDYICPKCKNIYQKQILCTIQDPAPNLPAWQHIEQAIQELNATFAEIGK